jgi:hypothetical protein
MNELDTKQLKSIIMQERIKEYFKNQEEIQKTVDFQQEVKMKLTKAIDDLMLRNGFGNDRGNYYQISRPTKDVRFYLKNDHLVDGKLSITFELWQHPNHIELGNEIANKLDKSWKVKGQPNVNRHHNNSKKGFFFQLGVFWGKSFTNPPEDKTITAHLSDIIETAYFKVPEGQSLNFVEFCMNELDDLQKD